MGKTYEQWVTTSEGEQICDIISKLIDHIHGLEFKIKELEEKSK